MSLVRFCMMAVIRVLSFWVKTMALPPLLVGSSSAIVVLMCVWMWMFAWMWMCLGKKIVKQML